MTQRYKGEYTRLFPSKVSSSNFLIIYSLYLLKIKPMYGKEILDYIEAHLGSEVWSPSHGTLYPLLKQMIEDGLIKHSNEEENKKLYSITSDGIKYLSEQVDNLLPILASTQAFIAKAMQELYTINRNNKE